MIRRKPVPSKTNQCSLTGAIPPVLSPASVVKEPIVSVAQLPNYTVNRTISPEISTREPQATPVTLYAGPSQLVNQAQTVFQPELHTPLPQPSLCEEQEIFYIQQGYQSKPLYEEPQLAPTQQPVTLLNLVPTALSVSPVVSSQVHYVRACCHCRQGIPASVHYNHCSFCRLDMCATCSGKHTQAHSSMVHDMVTVKPSLYTKLLPDKKFCARSGCHARSRLRTDCQLCKHTVCNDCFFEKTPVAHTHNRFATIAAPHSGFILSQGDTLPSCSGLDHLGHCSTCSQGIPLASRFNACGKCHRNFADSATTCMACGPPCSVHLDRNITVQLKVVSDTEFASYNGDYIRCDHCSLGYRTLESFAAIHRKHIDCTVKITTEFLEQIAIGQQRSCPLRPVRPDAPSAGPTADVCTICLHRFAYSDLTTCISCLKAGSFNPFNVCAHCFSHVPQLHTRHAKSPGQAPPFVSAAHPQAVQARAAIEVARKAAAARQAKQRAANRASLLGLGFKLVGAFVGAEIALDLGGGGGGGGGGGSVDCTGIGGAPMPSMPDMQFPDVFSGPVQSAAVDGIQG